ncbi:PP2C family protein-serine/threonine phosphatase [Enterovibrio baiacu]|uniref:PP2C family protein-serine/threonine phosphatase n=1 Tax=Enterovibrio baiacu TaxID=2491023 RepID=UPI003D136AC1
MIVNYSGYKTSLGDRSENLDRFLHYSNDYYFILIMLDGFQTENHNFVDNFCENVEAYFNLLSNNKKSFEGLESDINLILSEVKGRGKASVAICLGVGNKVKVFSSGDTRVYLINSKVRTKDHSVAQKYIDDGRSPPESLAKHPHRRKLFKFIDKSTISLSELTMTSYEDNDFIILASDGAWSIINDEEIFNLSSLADMEIAFENALNRKPSNRDNITIACISLQLS